MENYELYQEIQKFKNSRILTFSDNVEYTEVGNKYLISFKDIDFIFIDSIGPISNVDFTLSLETDNEIRLISVLNNGKFLFHINLQNKFLQMYDGENKIMYLETKEFSYDLLSDKVYDYPLINCKIEKHFDNNYIGVVICKPSYYMDDIIIYRCASTEMNSVLIDINYMMNKFNNSKEIFELLVEPSELLFVLKGVIYKVLDTDDVHIRMTVDGENIIEIDYNTFIESCSSYFFKNDIFMYNNKWYNIDELNEEQIQLLGENDKESSFIKLDKVFELYKESKDDVLSKDLYNVITELLTEIKKSEILNILENKDLVYINNNTIYKYNKNFIDNIEMWVNGWNKLLEEIKE